MFTVRWWGLTVAARRGEPGREIIAGDRACIVRGQRAAGHGAAQPEAVDQRREAGREPSGFGRGQQPSQRVFAVIDASFAPDQCAPEVVTAWLSFWAQVGQSAALARIQGIYERRLASNLLSALNRLLPAPEARRLAAGLAALIDGLWLRCALTGGALAPDEARAIARDYFTTQLAAARGDGQTPPTNGELEREKGSRR